MARCRPVWKSKFYGAFVLNHRVVLPAIDATPARWRGDAGSSPREGASTAASSPRYDLVKNCRMHPTHCLISTQLPALERRQLGQGPGQALAHVIERALVGRRGRRRRRRRRRRNLLARRAPRAGPIGREEPLEPVRADLGVQRRPDALADLARDGVGELVDERPDERPRRPRRGRRRRRGRPSYRSLLGAGRRRGAGRPPPPRVRARGGEERAVVGPELGNRAPSASVSSGFGSDATDRPPKRGAVQSYRPSEPVDASPLESIEPREVALFEGRSIYVDASMACCCEFVPCRASCCTPTTALLCKLVLFVTWRCSKLRVSSKGWRGNSKLVRSTKCCRMHENAAAELWPSQGSRPAR